jgi:acetyl-CoA carboxylase biotin carboxyl carrier protein
MTLDEIKQLIEFIKGHELHEFELEQDGVKIRIKSGGNHYNVAPMPQMQMQMPAPLPILGAAPVAAPAPAPAPAATGAAAAAPSDTEEGSEVFIVKSPIVGTFYRAAEPGSKDFVSIGDTVRKGQVLCIIEAMKLMNEIESEYDGEIVKAYVENGQPVQFGERLFAIKAK